MDPIISATSKILLGVFGLVILLVAVQIAAKSKKAQYADTARTSANVFVAIVFLAIGSGAIAYAAFGTQILQAFGISGAPATPPAKK